MQTMMSTDAIDLLTAGEVAELLRMNLQVIQRKLQAGEIPGYRIGKEWRVDRAQLVAWLEQRSNQRDQGPLARAGIAQFFDADGRLVSLPAPRAKRLAVLRHLAAVLDPDRTYTEREISEVLRATHDDVATLRREMVAAKLVVRTTDGIYRRTSGRAESLLRRA